jgi:uncharacterized iron-regulated membrane protein
MNRLLYSIHKWISAIAFVQLSVWTVTGFFFSVTSQAEMKTEIVEGAHRGTVSKAPSVAIGRAIEAASPAAGAIEKVELRATPTGVFYVVSGETAKVRVDARSGEVAPVGRDEAEAIARSDQKDSPAVRATTLVIDAPPIEYRGECEQGDCALPAYRVALSDAAGTVVYVDASTGDVTARRNDLWRTYDFLWSLHIMDYRGRESFNHLLIHAAAGLAMATVLSGIVLLCVRAVRRIRRWAR